MAGRVKGTVTALASIFPVEEAQKAVKRVQDSIDGREKELEHLRHFITDNTALVNLVQKLPDELSHDIMVPFGKAAFFPGCLIHTNELLVLLGDGYYAERTTKQTTEILQRRGKALESQVDSLKAMISDLQAEASFFSTTAAEAAEGLVEIREEYIEESPTGRKSQSNRSLKVESPVSCVADGTKEAAEDEDYARIMARLDELEEEELAAGERDEDEGDKPDFESFEHEHKDPPLYDQMDKASSNISTTDLSSSQSSLMFEGLKAEVVAKEEIGGSPIYKVDKSDSTKMPLLISESREKVRELEKVSVVPAQKMEIIPAVSLLKIEDSDNAAGHTSSADHRKNIIGAVMEHNHGIPSNRNRESSTPSTPSQLARAATSNPSKPVSRFKMQRGSH